MRILVLRRRRLAHGGDAVAIDQFRDEEAQEPFDQRDRVWTMGLRVRTGRSSRSGSATEKAGITNGGIVDAPTASGCRSVIL